MAFAAQSRPGTYLSFLRSFYWFAVAMLIGPTMSASARHRVENIEMPAATRHIPCSF